MSPVAAQDRPLLSLVVMAYNQEAFVAEAVAGALAQDYRPLQVILSDDGSQDDTFAVMQAAAAAAPGDIDVTVRRNTPNLGLVGHVNLLLAEAAGELVVLAAGDDICAPERCTRLAERYASRRGAAVLIHSDARDIDAAGRVLGRRRPPVQDRGTPETLALARGIHIGATAALSRALIEAWPPMDQPDAWEDLVWGLRAALSDGLEYLPEPLVRYRTGIGLSATGRRGESLGAAWRRSRRSRQAMAAVLRQRLADLDRAGQGGPALRAAMARRIAIEEMCVRLQQGRIHPGLLVRPLFWSCAARLLVFALTQGRGGTRESGAG